MCEFEKGQIVYVSDNGKNWRVAHYSGDNECLGTNFPYCVSYYYTEAINGIVRDKYTYCLSVEDYHKMLNQPKDKDLVWAWDRNYPSSCFREAFFYDNKNKSVFKVNGNRGGLKYDNYEVIPRDQWPQWAVESYELLED